MPVEIIREQEVGGPRPPTQQEIAQAILDDATEALGRTPDDISAGFQELHVEGGGASTVSYWGPVGVGTFEMPWPTTPAESEEIV
jgi:hypothetical protein